MALFAILVTLFYIAVLTDAAFSYRNGWRLVDVAIDERSSWPRVSLIAAARNEERNIGTAVESLLAIDYPNLEIIIVNDRSTDKTGDILSAISSRAPQLKVVTLNELPPGWLGKNHALHEAAKSSTGEFLLFTDADVHFAPSTLRRAITHVERHRIDHLALGFDFLGGTLPLRMFVAAFVVFFSLYARPWKVKDPKSKAHIGIGGFNLVRRSLYERIGGHAPIAMRPDDDMKLGKLVKSNGGKQECLSGQELISVEWYPTFREAIHGLEKNSFSGVEYSWPFLIVSVLGLLAMNVWPFVAMFVLGGNARIANLVAAATIVVVSGIFAYRARMSPLYGFTFPLAVVMFAFVLIRAAIINTRDGGIRWRDTFYSMEELKKNKV